MNKLEKEEVIYEKVYNELNINLADKVVDKVEELMKGVRIRADESSYLDVLATNLAEVFFVTYKHKLKHRVLSYTNEDSDWDDI